MKLAVYIGKFSPFHNGHATVLTRALEKYDHVLVIVGSANQPRTPRLPWIAEERMQMIKQWYRMEHRNIQNKLSVVSIRDYWYQDQQWATQIQSEVNKVREFLRTFHDKDAEVFIVGADKDWSSYYVKLFPSYKKDLVKDGEISTFEISATTIRDLYFDKPESKFYAGELPIDVFEYIEGFKSSKYFSEIKAEYDFYKKYKAQFSTLKYPPIFVTVDAVVVQGGHILMVQRRSAPGKGCYALPGGFLNINETIDSAVIRELREETRLKVPAPVLMGCLEGREVFDNPNRSLRGRTITNAFLFHLNETGELHEVKGGSDATKAFWVPLSDLEKLEPMMFEDHIGIIQKMIGLL